MIIMQAEMSRDANGILAWIEHSKMRGIVVHAETPEKAWQELKKSVKVKIAFDYGLGVDSVKESAMEEGVKFHCPIPESGTISKEMTVQFC